jgi:Carboxylesterase type B
MYSRQVSRRTFLSGAAQAAFALSISRLYALESVTPISVDTPLGSLQGEESAGVRIFRGIPFAEPPVGSLRFRPTVPVKPWSTPRDATRFAASPIQPEEHGVAHNEDCLYLNVWAPAAKGSYPVFVWIHGGGFTGGHSFEPIFDGAHFADAGIVCVTVGYRLGVLGFLDMAPLLGPEYAGSANNGLHDLVAALEWVQQNIEAFGGDPTRVTVGGQSAGAKLTALLMGVPSAKPLFQQMVSESGGADRIWTAEQSRAVSEGFGKMWRDGTGRPISDLSTAPAASLVPIQVRLMQQWPHHFPLRAEIDGNFLPQHPLATIAAGSTAGKKLLIGTNREESASFIGPHPEYDAVAGDLGTLDPSRFHEVYSRYAKVYPQMSVEMRRIRALTAEEYWIPSIRVAESHIAQGSKAWMYRLDLAAGSGRLGAFAAHSQELRMVWDRPAEANATSEIELTRQVHEAWCAFLRGDAPAAGGLPQWPEYTLQARRTMILDKKSHVDARPQDAERQLWNSTL